MQLHIFFGRPGSGKGTQREMLEKALIESGRRVDFFEMGKELREYTDASDSSVRKNIKDVMLKGGLVPSAFPINRLSNKLILKDIDADDLIIDGIGRKLIEAKVYAELFSFLFDLKPNAFFLDISEEEVMTRLLKRKRADDNEEVIKNRLKEYSNDTVGTSAAVSFFRECEGVNFHEIDGMGTVEEVHNRIISKIKI